MLLVSLRLLQALAPPPPCLQNWLVQGLGFGVWGLGLGFGVWGLGFRGAKDGSGLNAPQPCEEGALSTVGMAQHYTVADSCGGGGWGFGRCCFWMTPLGLPSRLCALRAFAFCVSGHLHWR